MTSTDVVVIGGGQAGLAAGYYLRRTGLDFVILDDQDRAGGAWGRTWPSLRLFSPAQWSSLPGWPMPGGEDEYPTRHEVLDYLSRYEARYGLPVERPVHVDAVRREADGFRVETDDGTWRARGVVSATGTWAHPHIPPVPGRADFRGRQLHSVHYRDPGEMAGKRVLVVGGGNSGAQILAEVSRVADATWVTLSEPTFLPDEVDGRVLFERATALYRARQEGRPPPEPVGGLGDIVMVEPVREARERGVLGTVRPFRRLTRSGVIWPDGTEERVDVVIWCTGFSAALDHLEPLDIADERGRIAVEGTRAIPEPRLWLIGYGNWTGFASATLIGVGRTARQTVQEIERALAD